MDQFLKISLDLRLAILFVIGATVASFLNLAIYRLAWFRCSYSPWSKPPEGCSPRTWFDRVPIFGWLSMRRETAVHGSIFWIRPLLLELFVGLGYAALYWWEVKQLGVARLLTTTGKLDPAFATPLTSLYLHQMLLVHLVLMSLMFVATWIDIDEKTIPDSVTVPGTLIGLLLAALLPWSLLPAEIVAPGGVGEVSFLHLASPNAWPAVLSGPANNLGLMIGLACYVLWCFWLLPRTWHGRYGLVRATRYFFAKIVRHRSSRGVLLVLLLGVVGVLVGWNAGGRHWDALLSSLVGLVAGGGIIWIVRLIGSWLLGREAMGFGDVTLMAMIGAFLGWQVSVMVFFLAPLLGLAFGIFQLITRRENEIPYGPFLCVSATAIVIRWPQVWELARQYFSLGLVIPMVLGICLVLMVVILQLMQWAKKLFSR